MSLQSFTRKMVLKVTFIGGEDCTFIVQVSQETVLIKPVELHSEGDLVMTTQQWGRCCRYIVETSWDTKLFESIGLDYEDDLEMALSQWRRLQIHYSGLLGDRALWVRRGLFGSWKMVTLGKGL